MIILHAGYCEDEFLIWGETHADGTVRTSARFHSPFEADLSNIMAGLKSAGIGLDPSIARIREAVAWLPSLDNRPIPSSPLIGELPENMQKAVLAPWSIFAFRLIIPELVDLLCLAGGKHTLMPGLVVGRDLAFWGEVLRFAGTLVARQRFLPGVGHDRDQYRAVWEPVLLGPDYAKLTRLARNMPAAARALTATWESAPENSPDAILHRFVRSLVEYMVRAGNSEAPSPIKTRRKRKIKAPRFDSLHDQWLFALKSPEGSLSGDAAELAEFAEQVQQWQGRINALSSSHYRLCFRLEEPNSSSLEGDTWYVRFLLQDISEPSVLIPAQEVWNNQGGAASGVMRGSSGVRRYLLHALGQASRLSPAVEESLKTGVPAGFELDTSGAFEFLTKSALVLEQAGFIVMLPAWWTGKGTRLRLTARAKVESPHMQGGSGKLSLDQVMRFEWELALGGEKISPEELLELAKLKSPLVKRRGQWVQMDAEEIQAALNLWKKRSARSASAREVVRMALGGTDSPTAVPFEGVIASGWIADLVAQLQGHAAFEELTVPEKFNGTLRPYQVRGYSWLSFLRRWGLGACLADDMGLGKTVQTLALIQRDWESEPKRPVLLICPTSVMGNWQKEAARFTPDLPVLVHHGSARRKGEAFKKKAVDHAIVVTSYALLYRDYEILKNIDWAGIILDEAQNIKNPDTRQAKAARSLKADYRIALTGTPVENHVGELWSIMEFLNHGFLGTQAEFRQKFYLPIQTNRDPQVVEQLQRLTSPFILRRLKTDKSIIADLPEKMEMKVYCNLTKEQASLYTAVVKEAEEALTSAEGIQRKGLILATLSKLKQVCNHPAQFLGDNSAIPGRSGKLARLTEMMEEILEAGERALVFSQFYEMGEIIRKHLQEQFGREVLFLHGALPKSKRDRMVQRFQENQDGPRIFVLSLKAGGTGLNLTRANHVFHFDRWWNPAVEDQATDRAFRIGQTRNVQVHKFLCAGTLEERIDEMIESKKQIAGEVVGSGEAWLTELSTSELKDLLRLRKGYTGG